jgi:hypothetical protein
MTEEQGDLFDKLRVEFSMEEIKLILTIADSAFYEEFDHGYMMAKGYLGDLVIDDAVHGDLSAKLSAFLDEEV